VYEQSGLESSVITSSSLSLTDRCFRNVFSAVIGSVIFSNAQNVSQAWTVGAEAAASQSLVTVVVTVFWLWLFSVLIILHWLNLNEFLCIVFILWVLSNVCYFPINPSRTKLYPSELKTQSVPRSKYCDLVIKTSQLMLYREIIAVCSDIHAKHINAL